MQQIANDLIMIGLSLESDWSKRWGKFAGPIIEWRKVKPKQSWITFNTEMKTALLYSVAILSFLVQEWFTNVELTHLKLEGPLRWWMLFFSFKQFCIDWITLIVEHCRPFYIFSYQVTIWMNVLVASLRFSLSSGRRGNKWSGVFWWYW